MLFIFFIIVGVTQSTTISRHYGGRNLLNDAEILRDKTSKNAVLNFKLPLDFWLYSGDTVEGIDLTTPLLADTGPGNFTLNIPKTRKYFQLITKEGKALISDHHLPLGFNYRDMGGIQAQNGRHVKYGIAFRTDEIINLSADDISYLNSIPIKTVVDFRSLQEKTDNPDVRVSEVYLDYPINPGNLGQLISEAIAAGDMELIRGGMDDMYRDLVTDPAIIEVYKNFFVALRNPDSNPLIWHCSAGKDRAGTAAILFLFSLGVSRDRILEDYLESNANLVPKYADQLAAMPILQPVFEVTERYFQALLDTILATYTSVDEFLTKHLNVDLNEMRRLYLE